MESFHDSSGEEFGPLSEEISALCRALQESEPVDYSDVTGVLGYGRSVTDPNAIAVFVGTNTNLQDESRFPRTIGGETVVYEVFPPVMLQPASCPIL